MARRSGSPAPQTPATGHNVLALVASYHGVKGPTVKNLFALEQAAQDAGHSFAFESIDRTPLDLARNETVTKLLASKATVGLFLDDDCEVDPAWLPLALDLLKEDRFGIITAPCRLRGEKVVFNIDPITSPFEVGGMRVMGCGWTGFGCVLVRRDVLQAMHDRFPKLHYRSEKVPGRVSCGMFRSDIVSLRLLGLPDPPEEDIGTGLDKGYTLDDHVWSLRARALGFKIWATIDVDTCHDGYRGNFGVELDAHEAEKAARAAPPAEVVEGLVNVICPTYGRPEWHPKLYESFDLQTYPQKDLWVWDDSPEPSPFFSALRDERVHYVHSGAGSGGRPLGPIRNMLIEGASGEIIAHFDDDDFYAEDYLSKMVEALDGRDLVKLSVWNVSCESDGSQWQVDSRSIVEDNVVLEPNKTPSPFNLRQEMKAGGEEAHLWGYGFSYVYRRSLWQAAGGFGDAAFGEDWEFIRRARPHGKLGLVDTMADRVVHRIHDKNGSRVFAQKKLGP
jgi:GT2 family glycosyltransferase